MRTIKEEVIGNLVRIEYSVCTNTLCSKAEFYMSIVGEVVFKLS